MPEKVMLVKWPDGTTLSNSQKVPGDLSPLARGADGVLSTQVTLSEIPTEGAKEAIRQGTRLSPEGAALAAAAGEVLGTLAALASIKAAPHVKRWVKDRTASWRTKPDDQFPDVEITASVKTTTEPFTIVTAVPADTSDEMLVALRDYRTLSSDEARARLAAAIVARLFSDEQLRILRDAVIEDDGPGLVLAETVDDIDPHQLEQTIRGMLEANPTWPDDEMIHLLRQTIAEAHTQEPAPLVRPLEWEDGEPPSQV